MIGTQVYLTEAERSALRELAARSGRKQSELIREALDGFIALHARRRRRDVLKRSAGLWRGRTDLPDSKRIRQSSDR